MISFVVVSSCFSEEFDSSSFKEISSGISLYISNGLYSSGIEYNVVICILPLQLKSPIIR